MSLTKKYLCETNIVIEFHVPDINKLIIIYF